MSLSCLTTACQHVGIDDPIIGIRFHWVDEKNDLPFPAASKTRLSSFRRCPFGEISPSKLWKLCTVQKGISSSSLWESHTGLKSRSATFQCLRVAALTNPKNVQLGNFPNLWNPTSSVSNWSFLALLRAPPPFLRQPPRCAAQYCLLLPVSKAPVHSPSIFHLPPSAPPDQRWSDQWVSSNLLKNRYIGVITLWSLTSWDIQALFR